MFEITASFACWQMLTDIRLHYDYNTENWDWERNHNWFMVSNLLSTAI